MVQSPRLIRSIGIAAALALAGVFLAIAAPGESDPEIIEATELYDAARYDEARPIFERLDAEGRATGPLLYRLSYCQRVAGQTGAAGATLRRSVQALEQEVLDTTDMEVPFYLVNAYQNSGRRPDGARVAAALTARVEAEEIPEPTTALNMFRLGKLYADQDQDEGARRWYSRAVEAFGREERPHVPYLNWASRYLADQAYRRNDFEEAAEFYATLLERGGESAADYDRLASVNARVGRYADAAAAWRKSGQLKPQDPDRPRYCANLADRAASIGKLPSKSPSGQSWSEPTKEELEAILLEQSRTAREAIGSAREATTLKRKQRKKLQKTVDRAQGLFVAAALEYALRGHDIRATAFMGGYAPLIFRARDWELTDGS